MSDSIRRRHFLRAASAAGVGAGLLPWSRLAGQASAAELRLTPDRVALRPEIEPVVQWIEDTPRERIIEEAADRLAAGLSYRDLLAGLFLAGIRNVKPRPVGFKFHAVLVINSAHLLAQTADEDDRLLPIFWALDNFKSSQAADVKEGDWTLGAVDEARLPSATQARAEFKRAMDAWDAEAADASIAALCRTTGAGEVMELLWHYGARDQRNIGHKPIFTMQCWRTLQAIGWQHAEPVLRSLVFGILDTQGDGVSGAVGPFETNRERVSKLREGWTAGKLDPAVTASFLATLREASSDAAADKALEHLNAGVAPESLWDAVQLAAGELFIRNPAIIALHAVTASNALHYTYQAAGDPSTRALALLQAAGWIPLYRQRSDTPGGASIDALTAVKPEARGEEALAEIAALIDTDKAQAAAKALGYLEQGGSADSLFALQRRLIFHKGRDSHDYKFGAAAWEEFELASDPKWRPALMASSIYKLAGSGAEDSPLMKRAREAVSRIG